MISELLTAGILIGIFSSGIRLATSYLFAALGETFGQRSGVLNLGVDGVMLLGAFGAYYTVLETGSLGLGVLMSLIIGLVMGIAIAFVNITLHAEQGISGIGFYLFGFGMSDLLFRKLVGTPRPIPSFPKLPIPLLSDIPIIGEILFQHGLLTYLAFLLVPIASFILNRTTLGLRIRAVGQNPEAADTLGVNVARIRYLTVIIGNTLAGLAGASLSIALLGIFQQNLTNGQGFIAVALVYFGAWRPAGVMAGALLYGLVASMVLAGNTLGLIPKSASDIAAMMPALITILALVIAVRRVQQPAALTKSYERGD
jgi:ABC-type uncharacterized transport system permease subunit